MKRGAVSMCELAHGSVAQHYLTCSKGTENGLQQHASRNCFIMPTIRSFSSLGEITSPCEAGVLALQNKKTEPTSEIAKSHFVHI